MMKERICHGLVWTVVAMVLCLLPGMTQAEQRPVLRVGINFVAPGYEVQDELGFYHGMDTDYMQALASYLGMDCEFRQGSWEDNQRWLQNGEIDVIPGLVITKARRANMRFSNLPMGWIPNTLYLHGGVRSLPQYVASGQPLNIGLMAGAFHSQMLAPLAAAEGFSYQYKNYDNYLQMLQDYDQQKIDGFQLSTLVDDYDAAMQFDVNYLHFAVRKDNTELLQKLDEAADKLALSRPDLLNRLYHKNHIDGVAMPLLLSKAETEYLRQHPVLRVAVTAKEPPLSYMQDEQFSGVVADLMQRMGEDLGITLKPVIVDSMDEAFVAVNNGEVDMVFDVFADFSWAAQKHCDLTAPLMTCYYTMAIRREGLPTNPKVACLRGRKYTADFVEPMYQDSQRIYFDTADECLRAVAEGRADVTYLREVSVQYNIWQGGYPELMTTGGISFSHESGIGIPKTKDAILLQLMDKEINHIGQNKVMAMVRESSVAVGETHSARSLFYQYPYVFLGGAVVLVILAWLVALRIMHMRNSYTKKFKHLLYCDAGTGLNNRIWLEETVTKALAAMQEQNKKTEIAESAMVVFVLPRLDVLISTYGKSTITELMRQFCEILAKEKWVRATAVRSGSGQVLVFTQPLAAAVLRQHIRNIMLRMEFVEIGSMTIRMLLSVGVCQFTGEPPLTVQQAMIKATLAARTADGVVNFFDEVLEAREQFAQKVENCMQRALAKKEFQVWYQPKYDIETYKCVGAEALVRWQSEELGFLPPGQFIGIFEKTGFITQLDFFMLQQVYEYQHERQLAGLELVPISVNQSRLHFQEQDYLQKMQQLVKKFNGTAGLELEITETAFDFANQTIRAAAVDVVRTLKQLGFRISMDDFGSGYSDLALLNLLPLDVMKLDRTLLIASEDSKRMQKVLTNAISMGQDLGMEVICEGIETTAQEQLLLKCGCKYGQGYLYGKPMPEKEFTDFLATHL